MSDPNAAPESPGEANASEENPLAQILFGWVEARRTPALLFWGMLILSAGLIFADLSVDRHEYVGASETTGYYGVWGFISFSLAVLSGWPLGRLLRRGEDYYGEAEIRPRDSAPDEESETDR